MANVLSIPGRLSNSSGRTLATLTETFAGIAGLCTAMQLNYGEPRRGRRSDDGPRGTTPEAGRADLFDLPDKVTDFDAAPFLCEASRTAFETPDAFLKDDADVGALPRSTGTTKQA